jgi:tetratricopeptide (TPR) repeat protein
MKKLVFYLTILSGIFSAFAQQPTKNEASLPPIPDPTPPMILDRLGEYRRDVVTDSEEARRWFNQGMALMLGYNFDGAISSFREATRIDPNFAMAWWGIGYSGGPNQNNPGIDKPKDQWSYAATRKAFELREREKGANKALIEALIHRYTFPVAEDLTAQNEAYLSAMNKVNQEYPLDPDVAVWKAEAMICMQPWNYWTLEGEPVGKTLEFRAILERVMRQHPNHPAANHLYIHTMESSPWPELAEPAADRLVNLVPAAGHLVHMPSHIWMQTGRYDDAANCNRRAAALDDAWFEGDPKAGEYRVYMAHNRHFLAWAATMQGRRREALSASRAIETEVPPALMEAFAPFSDGVSASKWHVLVRFGMWQEILKEPGPPEWALVGKGMQHYAKGIAYANTERHEEAAEEIAALDDAVEKLVGKERKLGNQPASEVMKIAQQILRGEAAFKAGRREEGLKKLKKAVNIEERIVYAEPAPWMMPARHAYGALLVVDGKYQEAEKVFIRDLEIYPANGWALLGLRDALNGQGREDEAKHAERAFRRAWVSADVMPPAACYCAKTK